MRNIFQGGLQGVSEGSGEDWKEKEMEKSSQQGG